MKKLYTWSLIVVLVLSISLIGISCNVATTETTTAAVTTAAVTTTAETTAAETTAAPKPVTINFIHYRSEDAAVYKKLIPMFEKENPNITVDMQIPSSDMNEYNTIIKTRLMGGQVDIYLSTVGTFINDYDKAGYCYDFSKESFINNYITAALDIGTTADGRIIGLYQSYQTFCNIYDKGIFEKYNLKYPSNYEEFIGICNTLNENGIPPLGIGLTDNFICDVLFWTILGAYSPNSNPFPGLENGSIKYSDEPFKSAFLTLADMAKKKVFPKDAAGTKYDGSLALFAQGKTAMVATGTWSLGGIKAQNPAIVQGIMIQPAPGVDTHWQFVPGVAFCINPKSANLTAAIAFVKFMSSPEAAAIYGTDTLQNVTIKDAKVNVPELAEVNNVLSNVVGLDKQTKIFSTGINFPETMTIDNETCALIMSGANVDDAIAKAQDRMDALIESKK